MKELIDKYAEEIQRIADNGTIGDFTWQGVLFEFLREAHSSGELDNFVQTLYARSHG